MPELALVAAALAGDRRALARLLSWVENGTEAGQAALAALYPRTGRAHIVGLTGSPGSGKSTLIGRVAQELRQRDNLVAIVAVDPSSPFSGGALLGDRLRMQDLVTDPGVFVRSMASRGQPGGLARATRDMIGVLDAVGFPFILVETVGAGQAEVDIARTAHTVVLVEAPGMGDDVQALKAGLMEIADILVVNKADRPEAQQTIRILQTAQQLSGPAGHHGAQAAGPTAPVAAWSPPIVQTVALEDRGVAELVEAILAHRRYLEASGYWQRRLEQQARAEVETWLQRHLLALLRERIGDAQLDEAVAAVYRREQDPASAARQLLEIVLQI
jgi:LAO/AO transport system kinase